MSTRKKSRSKKMAVGKAGTRAAVAKTKAPTSKAEVTTKKAKAKKVSGEKKPKRVSALDAAAKVLAKAEKPMRAQELIEAMADQGLWKSPGGKTPHATLYAAMLREIAAKGKDARFAKVNRGQFEFNKAGA